MVTIAANAHRPLVLVHGYSDRGESCSRWVELLSGAGYQVTEIHVADYISLSNEITIKDIAEGFDRAIRLEAGLSMGEDFDAIVHSTGMLVVRAWLMAYEKRRGRLKHLIGLAPATFGSPLAHKGRSKLGAIFKGNRSLGPDFMEQGDLVLRGLELGSKFTWDLAHLDFVAPTEIYGDKPDTPYPFIFIGLDNYGLIKTRFTDAEGSDGTVRWAGAGFNCRKIRLDLTVDPSKADRPRAEFEPWRNSVAPLVLVPGQNHTTILREPGNWLVERVIAALDVNNADEYTRLRNQLEGESKANAKDTPQWQQFVVHMIDERDDGIEDYFIELFTMKGDELQPIQDFDIDAHPYREDPSYRCFHVNLTNMNLRGLNNLWLRLIAKSGTQLVAYHGFGSERVTPAGVPAAPDGLWDAIIDISSNLPKGTNDPKFFNPFTTTLVEIRMNREPMPLELNQVSNLFKFLKS
jgi:hypothetical protein